MSQQRQTDTLTRHSLRDSLDDLAANRPARLALGIAFFVIATAVGARVAVPVPFTVVPMTLQPLFVILAGAVLGPWGGAGAMATYLALGAAGAPVFSAGNGGLPWLLGPTGGYLIAYPVAAFVTGWIAQSFARRVLPRVALFVGLVAGLGMIYVGGVSYLLLVTGQQFSVVVSQGVLPFLVGDALKVLIAFVAVAWFVPSGRSSDDGTSKG